MAQVYAVPILATFTAVTEADDCVMGPGFDVYINGLRQPNAAAFAEEELTGCQAEFVMGEAAAATTSRGSRLWQIQLEELIPAGTPETEEPNERFELKLVTARKTEVYYSCDWTSIRREFTRDGLRRIRRGLAMMREEELGG